MWQPSCQNWSKEKKNCGNGIAEIEEKREKNCFVIMKLLKIGRKKNVVMEMLKIEGEGGK